MLLTCVLIASSSLLIKVEGAMTQRQLQETEENVDFEDKDTLKAEHMLQWMEDQDVIGEKNVNKDEGSFKVSDFIHDQHFTIKDDIYDVHEERSVRRRRGASKALAGPVNVYPISAEMLRRDIEEIGHIVDSYADTYIGAFEDSERRDTVRKMLDMFSYTLQKIESSVKQVEKKEFLEREIQRKMNRIEEAQSHNGVSLSEFSR